MDLETSDRVNRFGRLASMGGITPPTIEQVSILPSAVPGATRPVPVIRVTFDERDFFAPGSTQPQPQAVQVMRVVAENMRRDVPDVRLTVLGHTDSVGSDAQNIGLSQGRAAAVVQTLASFGVNPGQLSAVAIGAAQPIAPNRTADGRARNRRVEFLISPYEQANLTAVSVRSVNPGFLSAQGAAVRSARREVSVLKPSFNGPADFSEAPLAPRGGHLTLASTGSPITVGDNDSGSPVSAAAAPRLGRAILPAAGDTGSPVIPAAD